MKIILLAGLLLQCVNTYSHQNAAGSAFLNQVLTQIQRERLGLLDEEFKVNDEYLQSGSNNNYVESANEPLPRPLPQYGELSSHPNNDIEVVTLRFPPAEAEHEAEEPEKDESDEFIKIILTQEEKESTTKKPLPPPKKTEKPSTDSNGDSMYYYYYYPLDQLNKVPPDLAEAVMTMMKKPTKMPMMPMMPMTAKPNTKMKKRPRTPVGPLFGAIAMFVGTAMLFIVSILLMPRVRLVKAKKSHDDEPLPHFMAKVMN